jgi:hypothetical protein
MRKIGIIAVLSLMALAIAAVPALAQNEHFVRASAALSGTNLVVSFKEAGLGDNQLVTCGAGAGATATYVCVNGAVPTPSAHGCETGVVSQGEAAQPGAATANPAGGLVGAAYYLQPGSKTVWPGGWHFAPPSFGPLLLLPGPKSGSAKAGAAVIERAATARIDASALRRMTPPCVLA